MSLAGAVLVAACGRHDFENRAGKERVADSSETEPFMRVSRALTEHVDLDMTTGARLVSSFGKAVPGFTGAFEALQLLVRSGDSAEHVLAAANDAGLRPIALAIVAAWYTGTVGQGEHASTVSYREALMQRTVADGLSPPTYAKGGPGWWTESPPDVELAPITPQTGTKMSRQEKSR